MFLNGRVIDSLKWGGGLGHLTECVNTAAHTHTHTHTHTHSLEATVGIMYVCEWLNDISS